jgi:glycosyltransferase involved in cell wall biosynthesis
MAIEGAADALRSGRLDFTIVGDGPERPALEQLADRLGVRHAVHFTGLLPPGEVGARYREADLLLFPSVKEFGGGVVLEAMAMGVVPCVVDYGGPGELVTPTTGFRLAMTGRDGIVAALAEVVGRIAADPSCLTPLSAAARARVEDLFTWPRKAEQVEAVHDWVLGLRPDKPSFDFLAG